MISRRGLLAGAAALVGPPTVHAQEPSGVRPAHSARVGMLALNAAGNPHQVLAFRRGLAELGWREGVDVVLDIRDAVARPDRLRSLAEELVAAGVDVIVAGPTQSTLAAMAATQSIPIIFPVAADPVGSGLVASLARPAGNVTGFSLLASDIVGKCLDVLVQIAPGRSRIAMIWQPDGHSRSTDADILRQAQTAIKALGLQSTFIEVRRPEDIDLGFEMLSAAGADAICVLPYAILFQHRSRVIALAAGKRIPAIYPWREFVDGGGLVSYGANTADLYRRAAGYVDRILRGSRPADLPVEQPTKFELVLNLVAARMLGFEIPPLLLARADELIE